MSRPEAGRTHSSSGTAQQQMPRVSPVTASALSLSLSSSLRITFGWCSTLRPLPLPSHVPHGDIEAKPPRLPPAAIDGQFFPDSIEKRHLDQLYGFYSQTSAGTYHISKKSKALFSLSPMNVSASLTGPWQYLRPKYKYSKANSPKGLKGTRTREGNHRKSSGTPRGEPQRY